jgi:hypothetical protein
MSRTLVDAGAYAGAGARQQRVPMPYWNPWLVGFLLGLVLLVTYAVTGRGLGATAAFSATAAWIAGLVSPAHVQANAVHLRYWNEGAPLLSWTVALLAGASLGAFVSGWQGRRFALCVERGPNLGNGARIALAFAGGFVAAYGAKIARGNSPCPECSTNSRSACSVRVGSPVAGPGRYPIYAVVLLGARPDHLKVASPARRLASLASLLDSTGGAVKAVDVEAIGRLEGRADVVRALGFESGELLGILRDLAR